MKTIEVEIRSFISQEKYEELLNFFRGNAKFVKEDYQETHYLDSEQDVRIQKNDFFSKIVMKKGRVHDDAREETEIKFDKEDFEKMQKVFETLGFWTKIKWLRKRTEFEWGNITVCLDHTRGYGYILELEIMSSETEKDLAYSELKNRIASLGIDVTSRAEFEKRLKEYQEHWKELIM